MKKLQLLALSMLLSTSMTFTQEDAVRPGSRRNANNVKGSRLAAPRANMTEEQKDAFANMSAEDKKAAAQDRAGQHEDNHARNDIRQNDRQDRRGGYDGSRVAQVQDRDGSVKAKAAGHEDKFAGNDSRQDNRNENREYRGEKRDGRDGSRVAQVQDRDGSVQAKAAGHQDKFAGNNDKQARRKAQHDGSKAAALKAKADARRARNVA